MNDGKLPKEEAWLCALRRLGRRENSTLELRTYLEGKGFEAEVITAVVDELRAQSLLDDLRYARLLARMQMNRGKGPAYIRMKLKQKGIAMEISRIRELLGEAGGASAEWSTTGMPQDEESTVADGGRYSELEEARKIVERRYPDCRSDRAETARAINALVRRGFSYDVAKDAVFGKKDG